MKTIPNWRYPDSRLKKRLTSRASRTQMVASAQMSAPSTQSATIHAKRTTERDVVTNRTARDPLASNCSASEALYTVISIKYSKWYIKYLSSVARRSYALSLVTTIFVYSHTFTGIKLFFWCELFASLVRCCFCIRLISFEIPISFSFICAHTWQTQMWW